jgi:hypothetical protein
MNQKNCLLVLLVLSLNQGLYGQRMKSMDFRNQQITDILMALAEVSGTSIIAGETVDGIASFHFTDSEFEDSLKNFFRPIIFSIHGKEILSGSRAYRGRWIHQPAWLPCGPGKWMWKT